MSAHPYVSDWRESRLQGMTTTLRKIRAADPCGMRLEDPKSVGYLKLRHHLGYGDDTPIDIATILDSNGLDYALWCLRAVDGHAREKLLYAYWCARQVPSLMEDPSSVTAPAERNANGAASDDELAAARAGAEAAWAALAARAALGALAARAALGALAATDASWAALAAARDARDAARAAQAAELKRICAELAAGRDPYPAAGVIA